MKTLFLILIFLCSSITYSQTTPGQVYAKGLEYFYSAKFNDAIKYFDEYIKSQSNEYKGYNFRGLCYLSLKNYPKAIEDFTKVITLTNSNSEGYINRANTFYFKGDPGSALKDFDEAIKNNPSNIEGYLGRGRVYLAIGKISNALSDLNSAAAVEPKNARVYINLAWAHLLNNDTSKAFENVKTAMFYDSNLVFTNYKRDLLYLKAENYKEVLDVMNVNIENNPESYLAYFARGFIYYLLNNYVKSRNDLVISLRLNERDDPQFEEVVNQLLRNIKRKT